MVTIVDATVPSDQFALGDTFERLPDAEFETVRLVAHETGRVMPFLWASASDSDTLYDALEDDATAESMTRLHRSDDRELYRMEWEANTRFIVSALVEEHGTLLGATGRDGEWTFRVLFPDRDTVSATYDFCREYGIDLSIRRVKEMTDPVDRGANDLSDGQYEALTAAFETDYYGIPRGMTLEELANELGVSHQALSERLRRGHRTLIASTLRDTPERAKDGP